MVMPVIALGKINPELSHSHMAKGKNIIDTAWIILAWLIAIALAYIVFVKIKYLLH